MVSKSSFSCRWLSVLSAMDKIAYLLYQIGLSKKMIYHPIHGSGTSVGKKSILKSLICEELWGGFTGSGQ